MNRLPSLNVKTAYPGESNVQSGGCAADEEETASSLFFLLAEDLCGIKHEHSLTPLMRWSPIYEMEVF